MAATSDLKRRLKNLFSIQMLEKADRDFVSATIEPLACDARIERLSLLRGLIFWLNPILLIVTMLYLFVDELQPDALNYFLLALLFLASNLIMIQIDIEIKVLKALKAKGLIRADEDQNR